MNKYLSVVFFFVSATNLVAAAKIPQAYYWKDFNGVIPAEALPAGSDSKGKPIFVGQAVVDDKIIPGKIFVGDNKLYYEWDEKPWSTNEGVKILCSDHPEIFEWVPTSIDKISEVLGLNLVKGGSETGFLVFVGRVQENEEMNVGKVVCRETRCLALYTALNGQQAEYHNYEILTYHHLDSANLLDSAEVNTKLA